MCAQLHRSMFWQNPARVKNTQIPFVSALIFVYDTVFQQTFSVFPSCPSFSPRTTSTARKFDEFGMLTSTAKFTQLPIQTFASSRWKSRRRRISRKTLSGKDLETIQPRLCFCCKFPRTKPSKRIPAVGGLSRVQGDIREEDSGNIIIVIIDKINHLFAEMNPKMMFVKSLLFESELKVDVAAFAICFVWLQEFFTGELVPVDTSIAMCVCEEEVV
ncbi:MAG: hypothetical protein EZS28_038154, partial [Streblomastix strix]